jgi:hypothetical protein
MAERVERIDGGYARVKDMVSGFVFSAEKPDVLGYVVLIVAIISILGLAVR